MSEGKNTEFCLIVEGFYDNVEEAKHALFDPFIEDYVEQTGKYKIHNSAEIFVASGIALDDLSIGEIEPGIYEISCKDSPQILTHRRAEQLAEKLRFQAMFDEITVEPIK